MWQGLSRFHQQQSNNLSNMMSNMQRSNRRRQPQGFGIPVNPSFGRQTQQHQHQMNRPGHNQQPYRGRQGQNIGSQGYNQRMNVLNHLKTLQDRHSQEFRANGIQFKDITNFNNSQDLCVQMEVQVRVNNQPKTLILKLGPQFPIQPPQFRFKQILIHPAINRETNQIALEKVTTYSRAMNTTSIIRKLEDFFRNSPPTNSPELEKLLGQVMQVNQAIQGLKNMDFTAFMYSLDENVKATIFNGNYECIRDSDEYKRAKERIKQLALHLRELKNDVSRAQANLEGMNAENSELLNQHRDKVDQLSDLKFSMSQLMQRFDEENVKKFLNDSVNQMNEKKDRLREQMMECDIEELPGLQEEYLKASLEMNKHLTLLDKAFAY